MSKKILIIDFNGTTPVYTYYFAKNLKSKDSIVDILGYKNKEELKYFDEKLNYIEINLKNKGINYFCYWIYLFFLTRKYDALVIEWLPFLKYSSFEIILIKILKKLNKNLFYTVHNFFPHNNSDKKIENRYLNLYQNLPNLLVHSFETKKKLEKYKIKNRIIKINHGALFSDINFTEKKDLKMIGMFGTISEYKGIEDAIKMLSLLADKSYYLYIAGKGKENYIEKLKKLVAEYNLENKVIIDNKYLSVEEIIKLTKKSSITLMPYKNIEQSGVALTSIGLGTPIVGYSIGGLKDLVITGYNGILVESGQYLELSKGVEKVVENYDYFQKNNTEQLNKISWVKNLEIILNEIERKK